MKRASRGHGTGPKLPPDQGQCLSLPCKECEGTDTRIRLDFTIARMTQLHVNDVEVYPAQSTNGGLFLTAAVNDEALEKAAPREQVIGYGLGVAFKYRDDDENVQIVDVDYKVRDVDGLTVRSVPAVHIQLIQLDTSELLIGSLTTKTNDEISCGAFQCWAYNVAGVAIGSGSEALQRCCGAGHSSHSEPGGTIHNATAHHPHDWHSNVKLGAHGGFTPMLTGLFALAVLASFAMFCLKAACGRCRRDRGEQSGNEKDFKMLLSTDKLGALEALKKEDSTGG